MIDNYFYGGISFLLLDNICFIESKNKKIGLDKVKFNDKFIFIF